MLYDINRSYLQQLGFDEETRGFLQQVPCHGFMRGQHSTKQNGAQIAELCTETNQRRHPCQEASLWKCAKHRDNTCTVRQAHLSSLRPPKQLGEGNHSAISSGIAVCELLNAHKACPRRKHASSSRFDQTPETQHANLVQQVGCCHAGVSIDLVDRLGQECLHLS